MSGAKPGSDPGAANRGTAASVAPDGSVSGSGAGAGGGGGPEEFDADSAAGGGADVEPREPIKPANGADAPNHGSR